MREWEIVKTENKIRFMGVIILMTVLLLLNILWLNRGFNINAIINLDLKILIVIIGVAYYFGIFYYDIYKREGELIIKRPFLGEKKYQKEITNIEVKPSKLLGRYLIYKVNINKGEFIFHTRYLSDNQKLFERLNPYLLSDKLKNKLILQFCKMK